MIQATIFDMDGLLIDSEPIWQQAEIELFEGVGIELNAELCATTMGFRLDEVIDHWYEQSPWEGITKGELQDQIVDRVMGLIADKGEALPGVFETLTLFEKLGIPIALASSSSLKIIDQVLNKLGIKNKFSVIQSAMDLEFGKPHPEIFLNVASILEVDPRATLVIEDSIAGVIAGRAAKMKVIAVPEQGSINDPAFGIASETITSLLEINSEKIERLFAV